MGEFHIGVDFGGTKIEILAMDAAGQTLLRQRVPTPGSYAEALDCVGALVAAADQALGGQGSLGIGIPGALSPQTGLIRNANTLYLNGHALDRDLQARLARPVAVENDANCFALSEAVDGAGAGHDVVFGVILGTGCGGAIVAGQRVLPGRHRIAGEWGHVPLPWPQPDELPYPSCFCGLHGCLERYVAGPSLAAAYFGGDARDARSIPDRAAAGDLRAQQVLLRHAGQVARGLAQIVNILDPDVIVIGGGLSNMAHLYADVPRLMAPYVIADRPSTPVLSARHGDSSGVRGAAWLGARLRA